MTVPEITCFHIGMLVDDIDKTIASYNRFFGDGHWRTQEGPWARMAYGTAAGQTWELIQLTGAGTSQFHQFRDQHGEGVHHIGFWTPDLRTSVENALAAGARLVSATTDAQGNTAVQLLPGADVQRDQLDALGTAVRPWAFLDLGLGGWRVEYVSATAGAKWLKDWLGKDYDRLVLVSAR